MKLVTFANASLLGNFEIVATTIIALLVFKGKISKKLWAAIGLITLSSIILSVVRTVDVLTQFLLVLGATACWRLENNCTRSISDKSTYQIVTINGFGSGTGLLIVAQKTLGAAKTSAYYAIAPFIGALLSFVFLHELQFHFVKPLKMLMVIPSSIEAFSKPFQMQCVNLAII